MIMKYIIQVRYIMHPGKRKDKSGNSHQEDSIYPSDKQLNDSDRFFVLCDGMGGHDAGEVASQTVCQAIGEYITSHCDPQGDFSRDILEKSIDYAFDALDAVDTGATQKMGTTMALLKLYNKGAVVAHIGDSRVYHIRPGNDKESTQVLHRTCDHSLVFDMIKAGIMTEEDARNSPHKNVITKALQPHLDSRPKPDITKIKDIQAGDYFYICSDGMIENMDSEELRIIFAKDPHNDIDHIRETLLNLTEENRDNHSAFIVYIESVNTIDGENLTDNFEDTCPAPSVTPPQFSPERLSRNNKPASSDDEYTVMPDMENTGDNEPTQPNDTSRIHKHRWLIISIIVIIVVIAVVLTYLLVIYKEINPLQITDQVPLLPKS